jgi:SAM-dependent methyltransferase
MIDDAFFPATTMPDWEWWRALWPDPAEVLRSLGIGPGMTAVDLCCGDGYFTAPMSRVVGEGGRVIGIDMLPAMLEAAKAHVAREGLDNVTWIEADARHLPSVLARPVDMVVIANTFHGVPDKTGLAGAVAAILDSGGRFAVVNWHAAHSNEETPVLGKPRGPAPGMRLSPEATRAAVEPAGFVSDAVEEVGPYHYGAVFRKVAD